MQLQGPREKTQRAVAISMPCVLPVVLVAEQPQEAHDQNAPNDETGGYRHAKVSRTKIEPYKPLFLS